LAREPALGAVNIPIGALLISVATTSIDESRDPEAGRLDFAGIALFGGGLSSIVWALIEANSAGWGSGSTLCKLAVGSVALGLFVVAERMQRRQMVDLLIFRDRTVVGAAVAMFGYAATAQGLCDATRILGRSRWNSHPSRST